MKNIISVTTIICLSFLTSCGGKVTNIVSFSKPVVANETNKHIILPEQQTLSSWDRDNIDVNIHLDSTNIKFNSHKLSLHKNISAKPTIIDDKIFVLTEDGYLTAFNNSNHTLSWSIDLMNKDSKSDYIGGGIAYDRGMLFVTNGSRRFSIIDASNGEVIFSKQFADLLVTKPVIQGSVVILQTMSNQIYMFDINHKAIVWDHAGIPETLQGGVSIDPVLDGNGRVLISYTSGQISFVDIAKRQELWQIDLSVGSTMPEYMIVNLAVSPISEKEYGYFADNNGMIFKIDLHTGQFVWKKDIDDVRTVNNTVNALIVTTNGRQVVAVDKSTGDVIWARYLGEAGKARTKWNPINYKSTLIINDTLNVYTSDGYHYVLSLVDGRILSKSHDVNSIDFVTITDKVRIFDRKKIFVSVDVKDSKLLGKLKKEKRDNGYNYDELGADIEAPVIQQKEKKSNSNLFDSFFKKFRKNNNIDKKNAKSNI